MISRVSLCLRANGVYCRTNYFPPPIAIVSCAKTVRNIAFVTAESLHEKDLLESNGDMFDVHIYQEATIILSIGAIADLPRNAVVLNLSMNVDMTACVGCMPSCFYRKHSN